MSAQTSRKNAIIYPVRCQYAIRALIDLARLPIGQCVSAQQLAYGNKAPSSFLSATLSRLVRNGILRSERGRGGGFALRLDPGTIRLSDVIDAIDTKSWYLCCAMGRSQCSDSNSCSMHEIWNSMRTSIVQYLNTSIADLAKRNPTPAH